MLLVLGVVRLVSQLDRISVLLEKGLRRKPSRMVFPFFCEPKPLFNAITREAQARRGEEPEIDPEQFQDPDNEMGLFAGMTYEADDEEADRIYEQVDKNMDARRRARRCVHLVSSLLHICGTF